MLIVSLVLSYLSGKVTVVLFQIYFLVVPQLLFFVT